MSILEEDFKYIKTRTIPWERLKKATVLITGGTGFLGSLLIRYMEFLNREFQYEIHIIALVKDVNKLAALLPQYRGKVIESDLCNTPIMDYHIDYMIHCAAITKSQEMLHHPVEVVEGIVNGTQNILKLAQVNSIRSMVYLSSMEVYGTTTTEELVRESDMAKGEIDMSQSRSCYPMGKRMAELLCGLYCTQYQVPVKIARLAQTFGAGVLDSENRVFAQFAKAVIEREDIVLHTDGTSWGNYCYSADTILGIFTVLFSGEDGEAYNIVNEETRMTIGEMAELVASQIAGGSIQVLFDIPDDNTYGYAQNTKLRLSSEKIRKLGWKPQFGMVDMYMRMIKSRQ